MQEKKPDTIIVDKIYDQFKKRGVKSKYQEEQHCKMLISIMSDYDRSTVDNFCVEALITESTFRLWVRIHEIFREIYYFSKMIAKIKWQDEGRRLKSEIFPIGSMTYEFEHWKMIGWTRFGVSRNCRLKLDLDAKAKPVEHYEKILKQASDGDFTASEFKQLMEAVNVGLNVQQVYELQKQLDELKSDLAIMQANSNVTHPFTNPDIKKTDQDSVENRLCGPGDKA